jgi:hypothetical protein
MASIWQQVVGSVLGVATPETAAPRPAGPNPAQPEDSVHGHRYLLVVARDRPDLLDRVKRLFLMEQKVEAIVDRRHGERRRQMGQQLPERRLGDRRRRTGPEFDLALHTVIIASREEPLPRASAPGAGAGGAADQRRSGMEQAGVTVTRDRFTGWIGEGRELVGFVPVLLDRLAAVELECENLRAHNNQLQRENSRLRAMQTEVSAVIDKVLSEIAQPIGEIARKLRAA